MEEMMGYAFEVEEAFCSSLADPQTNDVQGGSARKSSPPSPEEGHRLIRAFVRIQRTDIREKIFNFVTEMLRAQDEEY
jgi:hypothetical protein